MTYDIYRLIFIVGSIACAVMFVVSVILFITLKIPNVIGDLTGRNAKKAIEALHRAGIAHTVMLTGDDSRVAAQIAEELRISEVHSELLPGDKVTQVEALLAKQPAKSKLAFVGDGINDAPVLSRADIGIAMGALGSDAAIEAADVVLMDDDPLKISKAIRIARKCIRIVYENIYFAIGIKLLCLLLGAIGIANMWFAIFADVGVMVLAVLNAIRALFVKKLKLKLRASKVAVIICLGQIW